MPITITLPFDVPEVRVLASRVLEDSTLLIEVESTLRTAQCHCCGREIDRLQATVQGFLETISDPLKATVRRVCIDRWEGYAGAVAAALPNAPRGYPLKLGRFAGCDCKGPARKPALPGSDCPTLSG